MKYRWLYVSAVAAVALATTACGTDGSKTENVAEPPEDDGLAIPLECRGFSFEDIRYSPGGDALPNTCQPFDSLTNNPYAVRCVDVLPGYSSGYVGDEYCILPPPPELGTQFGVHPQSRDFWPAIWNGDLSGYADAELTKDFVVEPGGEVEQVYFTRADNEEAHTYYRLDSRMRTGSHHLATYRTREDVAEGWGELVDGAFFPGGSQGFLWNAQRSDADRPASSLEIAEEDRELGAEVDANQGVYVDLHHFNAQDAPILREVWINLWWTDGEPVKRMTDLPVVAPVMVPPNSETVLEGVYEPKAPVRLLWLFGHRHAWTRRFNAWVVRQDGTETPVYDSFDWLNVPTYSYDSLSTNPVADPDTQKDGAASGLLTLQPGDALRFACHVDTTQRHAAELGVPVPKGPLVFGNRAFDAEMCILNTQLVDAE